MKHLISFILSQDIKITNIEELKSALPVWNNKLINLGKDEASKKLTQKHFLQLCHERISKTLIWTFHRAVIPPASFRIHETLRKQQKSHFACKNEKRQESGRMREQFLTQPSAREQDNFNVLRFFFIVIMLCIGSTETFHLLATSRTAAFREQRKRAGDKNEKVSHSRCLSEPTGQSVFSSLTSWPRRR